jgi:predicted TIM-barrel fold metal-dependent hydrolase
MTDLPWIVSVDDHVVEPPHLFENWLPSRFRGSGPQLERRHVRTVAYRDRGSVSETVDEPDAPFADVWTLGQAQHVHRASIVLRKADDILNPTRDNIGVTYDEMRPGCYEPMARLSDMDLNHVQASLCFPTMPRFCGQLFEEQTRHDRDLGLALVQAYNNWMVEEWCGDSNGRLIPLCLCPLWDAELAATEVRRNADRGVRAVTFSEIPYYLGLPSIHSGYWDPFFEACSSTGTVICMHIGSSSRMISTSPDAPALVQVSLTAQHAMVSLVDFIFSGILEKFPSLSLAYSEGQIGWIPYLLERMDAAYRDHTWAREGVSLTQAPSQLFRQHVLGCFFDDVHGIENAEQIGLDNITFETDYPHSDGTFPRTVEVASHLTEALPAEAVWKILRGNAIAAFGLSLPDPEPA